MPLAFGLTAAAGGLTVLIATFALPRAIAQALNTPSAPLLPPSRTLTPPASASGAAKSSPAVPTPGTTMATASGGMVTIESDQQQADNRTGIVTATGNVRIVYPERGLRATARQVQYFSKEARLVLSGDVDVIDADGQRIRAERLVYRLDSERLQAEPGSGRQVVSKLRLQNSSGQAPRPPMP
jgi:lipopolysaccharide export system protein LptA